MMENKKIEFIETKESFRFKFNNGVKQAADVTTRSSFSEVQQDDMFHINRAFNVLEAAYQMAVNEPQMVDVDMANKFATVTDKLIKLRRGSQLMQFGSPVLSTGSDIMENFDDADFGFLKTKPHDPGLYD